MKLLDGGAMAAGVALIYTFFVALIGGEYDSQNKKKDEQIAQLEKQNALQKDIIEDAYNHLGHAPKPKAVEPQLYLIPKGETHLPKHLVNFKAGAVIKIVAKDQPVANPKTYFIEEGTKNIAAILAQLRVGDMAQIIPRKEPLAVKPEPSPPKAQPAPVKKVVIEEGLTIEPTKKPKTVEQRVDDRLKERKAAPMRETRPGVYTREIKAPPVNKTPNPDAPISARELREAIERARDNGNKLPAHR